MLKMLKRLLITVTLFFVPVVLAEEVNQQSPYQKTEIAASKIFDTMNNQADQIKKTPDILKEIVKDDLLPYVHVKYAAALALGDYYKNVSKSDRDTYFVAFEQYLVQAFAQALSVYNGQSYQIESEKDVTGKNIVSVRVLLTSSDTSQQSIRLDFQWRKNSVTGEWQAYDMIAEGVSMITTKQNEWSTTLRQDGIGALIKQLQRQANQKINPDSSDGKKAP